MAPFAILASSNPFPWTPVRKSLEKMNDCCRINISCNMRCLVVLWKNREWRWIRNVQGTRLELSGTLWRKAQCFRGLMVNVPFHPTKISPTIMTFRMTPSYILKFNCIQEWKMGRPLALNFQWYPMEMVTMLSYLKKRPTKVKRYAVFNPNGFMSAIYIIYILKTVHDIGPFW